MSDSNTSMMSLDELHEYLAGKASPLDINKIIAGYEMSEEAFKDSTFIDGTPFFYHLTRVARIILTELDIVDADIIVASLLHDYSIISNYISKEILTFNFGAYLTYLVDLLSLDTEEAAYISENFSYEAKIPFDDYLIIKLAEEVDVFRNGIHNVELNLVSRLCLLNEKLLPLARRSSSKSVFYLCEELTNLKKKITN